MKEKAKNQEKIKTRKHERMNKNPYFMVKVLDEVHEVVVDRLVVGVDDPVQVREIPIQVNIVSIGTTSQKVLAALKDQFVNSVNNLMYSNKFIKSQKVFAKKVFDSVSHNF